MKVNSKKLNVKSSDSNDKGTTSVFNVALDKMVTIPMNVVDLINGGYVYNLKACNILAINEDKYKSLSELGKLPKVNQALTEEIVVGRFMDYVKDEGLALSEHSCAVIFSCLPALDGLVIQTVLKNVGFWLEEWEEKTVSEMAGELDINQDTSTDELIDAIDNKIDDMDNIIHIESFYTERGLCWLYKGELK